MEKLTSPPADDRSRELWLQHAAGYIIFRDMKNYAIDSIKPGTDEDTKQKIIKGIDDAIYGLMMMMDGVTGGLRNDEYTLSIEHNILLEKNGEVIEKINTFYGDSMCMGYHDWLEGNFGEDDVVENNF